ncbi:MAG TPA: solute carrier family 23 protein [Ktedonobacterales bacterium]|nr:solute carrier family 23 protein [Ktedonobacterales bacterium]
MLSWRVKSSGVIAPDERLPWGSTIALGLQHALAMFGATVVAPLLMGFPVNTAIFFSGVATVIFFIIVAGKVPSYLGSSFAFIGPVLAVTGGKSANIPLALGGIVAAGAVYAVLALITMFAGTGWINFLMPPAVTGAVVMVIGLNLAGVGATDIQTAKNANHALITAGVTLAVALLSAVYLPGFLRRLPILLGGIAGYIVAILLGDVNFDAVKAAGWFGLPTFTTPKFDGSAIGLIAPVAIVLVAENTGHIKAVGQITRRNLDGYLGRGFLGDAISTMVSGFFGGTGVTTYAENIGVMAMTRVYSTIVFLIASVVALLLGLCPKFGALVQTIPAFAPGVLGGLSVVLFGLIAATGARIWVENQVDFGRARNLLMAGVALILGTGAYTITIGNFPLTGITLATLAAILLYQVLRDPATPESKEDSGQAIAPADSAAEPAGTSTGGE